MSNLFMKKDPYISYKKIVNELYDNEESIIFREPVDYKNLGLHDYPLLIKNPMDLSTMRKKIKTKKYKKVQDFINDIQLIWDNCKIYNIEGSTIYKTAIKMEKIAKKSIKKYLNLKKLPEKKKNNIEKKNNSLSNIGLEEFYANRVGILSEEIREKLNKILSNSTQDILFQIVNIIKEDDPIMIQIISDETFSINIEELSENLIQKILNFNNKNQKNIGEEKISMEIEDREKLS